MRKVVGYIRVSTEEQARHGYSLESQRQVLRDYAAGHGLEIAREIEASESAFKPGREGFAELLAFLENRKDVTAVLVYILLTRVERRTPPRRGVAWPDLEEMLRSGVLEQSGTYSALRDDIERRSQTEGFEIQAKAELALLARELGGDGDANR